MPESHRASAERSGIIQHEQNSPVEVGADLVGLASAESVALSATGLEEGSTLASITCRLQLIVSLCLYAGKAYSDACIVLTRSVRHV